MKQKRQQSTQKDKILNQIPIFLAKTYRIVENPEYADTIQWIPEENGFIVKNITDLTEKVFPKHFKHTNYASFVRQLNLYGFHKVRSSDDGHIFTHNYFQKQHPQLLPLIKRKNATPTQDPLQSPSPQKQKPSSLALCHPPPNFLIMPSAPESQAQSESSLQLERQLGMLTQKHESLQNLVSVLVEQNKEIILQNKSFINKINNMDQSYRKKLETLIFLMVFGLKNGDNNNNIIVPQHLNNMIKAFSSSKKEKKPKNGSNSLNNNIAQGQNNMQAVQLFKKPADQSRFTNKKIQQILQMLKMQSQGQLSGLQDNQQPISNLQLDNNLSLFPQHSTQQKKSNNNSISHEQPSQHPNPYPYPYPNLNGSIDLAPPSPMMSMRSITSRYLGGSGEKMHDDWNDVFEKLDHDDLVGMDAHDGLEKE